MSRFSNIELEASNKATVVVSCSISPSSFWCQLSDNLNKIDNLMTFITEHYAKRQDRVSGTELQIGMPCIAKFSEDENWYRGKIMKIGDGCCNVLFVDYGNTEEALLTDIQAIKPRHLLRWPAQALHCRLDVGATGIEWTQESMELFNELTGVDELQMEISEKLTDGMLTVSLEASGVSLFEKLLGNQSGNSEAIVAEESRDVESLPESDLEEDSEIVNPRFKLEIDASKILEDIEDLKPLTLTKEQRVGVTVSHCDSPSSFWIQQSKSNKDLDTLLDQMFEYYNELGEDELQLHTPQIGGLCAAKYVDDLWYRARVTGVTDSQAYEVYFLDHGNKEVLPGNSLKCLVSYFGSLPIQAVECAMAGLRSPEGAWNEEAKEAFKELTCEK